MHEFTTRKLHVIIKTIEANEIKMGNTNHSQDSMTSQFLSELKVGNFDQCSVLLRGLKEYRREIDIEGIALHDQIERLEGHFLLSQCVENWFDQNKVEMKNTTVPQKIFCSLERQLDELKKIVAITYHGRSGSYLLCSVFDGHPNFLTVDFTLNTLFRFFSDSGPSHNLQSEQDSAVLIKILKEIKTKLSAETFCMFCKIFPPMLRTILSNPTQSPDKGKLFKIIFFAWHHSHEYEIPSNPIIAYSKHTSSDEEFEEMAHYFDTVHLLQCTRQFDQTIASHIRHHVLEAPVLPFSTVVGRMITPYEDCLRRFIIADNFHHTVVRFEDIHKDIEQLSRSLCKRLDVPFNEAMTNSTLNQKPYLHERKDAKINNERSFSGFGHKNIHKKQPDWMSAIDILRLQCFFSDGIVQLEYSTPWIARIKLTRFILFYFLLFIPMRAEISAYKYAHKNVKTAEPDKKFVRAGFQLRIELSKRFLKRMKAPPSMPTICN